MTNGQPLATKILSKGVFERTRKRFKETFSIHHSRPASPQPILEHESSSGSELDKHLPLLGTQPLSSNSGLVVHDQYNAPTHTDVFLTKPDQQLGTSSGIDVSPHSTPEMAVGHTLSAVKEVAGVLQSFTVMLLKRLPDVVDTNPVTIVSSIVKTILEITDEVKGNIDAVERRILSTMEQLDSVEKALAGWNPDKMEERQAVELYQTILKTEWKNLIELKKKSMIRKIAVHEEDKGKIADIFERINRAREQLVVVTGIRVHTIVLEIQDDMSKILLEKLEASHAADHKSELEGEQRQLLRRAVCTPGTRVRILSEIVDWANNMSTDSQSVYWLSGQAGSGKSTIAFTIARRFEFAHDADDTIVLGGNFFCSRQLMETRSATRIVRTVAYHLALKCKAFANALHACGDFHTIRHGVRAQLESLLIKPWKQAHSKASSSPLCFLVVIDALDEIDGTGGSEFLRDLLDVLRKHHLPGLKFFVTSRPDPSLVTHLQSFKDKQFYRLEEVLIGEAQADITTYLNTNLPAFVGRPEIKQVVTQAAGLFIYAATVVKYLAGYEPREQKRRLQRLPFSGESAIRQIAEETTLLDDLYFQILSDAFRNYKDESFAERLSILHTFICSAERSSPSTIADLLFPPDEDNDEIDPKFSCIKIADSVLDGLHAVLYRDSNGKVFSYHKSFGDFLFDINRAKRFWCDQEKQHWHLAHSCFRVMRALKFNIANIQSSFVLDRDNPALLGAVKQCITPVLSYSCRSWDYHLSAIGSNDRDTLHEKLSEFLQLRVLFWIEAMNLLGARGQCEKMMQRAYEWVPHENLVLREALAEVVSFALYFSGSGASSSTPHLYISALATWSRNLAPCNGWKTKFTGIPKFKHTESNDKPLMVLGVGSKITAVAYSMDGKAILSGSMDGLVRMWDASTGEMLKVLEGHDGRVTSLAFLSDDKYIISSSTDQSVRLWDVSTGEMLKVLELGHAGTVIATSISKDGKRIVSGSRDDSVRVWDASTGDMLMELEGHTDVVTTVRFSSDARYIVSGSKDGSVRIWNASTGDMIKVLNGHTTDIWFVAFAHDDKWVTCSSILHMLLVWDASTGEEIKVLHRERLICSSTVLSDRYIVCTLLDHSGQVWDASTGNLLKVLKGHTAALSSVAFSNDNKRILTGSFDKTVRVWDASSIARKETLKIPDGPIGDIRSVSFWGNGRHIISGSEDSSVRIWDASTGELLKVLHLAGHTYRVKSYAFSTDGKRIVSGSFDKSVRVWDASSGEMMMVLKGHTGSVSSVIFSGDDKLIVSGSEAFDMSVRVWDASTGELLRVLEGHTGYVTAVAVSRDNKWIFSAGDNEIRVWDAASGETRKVISNCHPNSSIVTFALSSDERYIVSGSYEPSVRVWDVLTGDMLKVLEGYTSIVYSLAFSNDNKRIISGSSDKLVRVWDAVTGEMLKVLEGHNDPVLSVAFSSDDRFIVSGSSDKSVRIWDASMYDAMEVTYGHSRMVPMSPTQPSSLPYIREKITALSGHWQYSGWLLSPQGGHYLMYVPLSENLPDSANILTLPQSDAASVNFNSSTLGTEWHKCFLL